MANVDALPPELQEVARLAALRMAASRDGLAGGPACDYESLVKENREGLVAVLRAGVERRSTPNAQMTVRPAAPSLKRSGGGAGPLLRLVVCHPSTPEGPVTSLVGNDVLCEITAAVNGLVVTIVRPRQG